MTFTNCHAVNSNFEKNTLEKILRIVTDPIDTLAVMPDQAAINPMESEAFGLTLEGKLVKDIAEIMRVTVNTAGSYIKGITRKTGLKKADFGPHIFNQICKILADYEIDVLRSEPDDAKNDIVDNIKLYGPARVIIDEHGSAYDLKTALDRNFIPTVIFIRDDGWSLGAPDHLIKVAHDLYSDDWKSVLTVATGIVMRYPDWAATQDSQL